MARCRRNLGPSSGGTAEGGVRGPTGRRARLLVGLPAGWYPFLLPAVVALAFTACAYGAPLEEEEVQLAGTLVKFKLVHIPGGTYEMPDPEDPTKTRTIEIESFWIGKAEVTWDEYDVYRHRLDEQGEDWERNTTPKAEAVSRPSKTYVPADRGFGHRGYPAIGITYRGASYYCRWLSYKTGEKYRVPTEAEWEYACRAGELGRGPIEDTTWLDERAWHAGNSEEKTHAVGEKEPNAWGLHDTLGNTAEWCRAVDVGSVIRGGSFVDPAEKVCPAARERETEDWKMSDPQLPKSSWWLTDGPFAGFRIVREE